MRLIMLLIGLCLSLNCLALANEKYEFASEQQREDFKTLTQELRCPKCQNQNIADSNALIANDMKRKVHQLLVEGKSEQEVVGFMKQRYGEFVHYEPPMTPLTMWLYLGPILFIITAVSFLWYGQRKNKANHVTRMAHDTLTEEAQLKAAEKALKDLQ